MFNERCNSMKRSDTRKRKIPSTTIENDDDDNNTANYMSFARSPVFYRNIFVFISSLNFYLCFSLFHLQVSLNLRSVYSFIRSALVVCLLLLFILFVAVFSSLHFRFGVGRWMVHTMNACRRTNRPLSRWIDINNKNYIEIRKVHGFRAHSTGNDIK